MAATQVGLYYSVATGRLRWVLIPDDDSQLIASNNPGEALLAVSQAQYQTAPDNAGLQAIINAKRGAAPSADRYVLIDGASKIVNFGFLDPSCGDAAPVGMQIVQHDTADCTWTYSAGVFAPPPPPPPPEPRPTSGSVPPG